MLNNRTGVGKGSEISELLFETPISKVGMILKRENLRVWLNRNEKRKDGVRH